MVPCRVSRSCRAPLVLRVAACDTRAWPPRCCPCSGRRADDFVYYGTTFNQPQILLEVFGRDDSLNALALQNIATAAFGLPGVVLGIAMLRCLGTKSLQSWGFVAILVASLALAASSYFAKASPALSFSLMCVLITALNWGANVSTYVLPTEAFPAEVRASMFGVSAAIGKLGALAGGFAFGPIFSAGRGGPAMVFLLCAALAAVGVLVTHRFVEPFGHESFCRRSAHVHARFD